jgi:ABC-type glycerol-3-phosphate transport system substrate-binding protein
VWANGADILTKDHKKSALADSRAVAGLQFLADLKHRWRVTPTDEALKTAPQGRPFFESGRLALRFSGSFYYAQIKDAAKFKWGVAQVPQGPAGSTPGVGGWFVGAGAGTKKEDAQAAFLAFYLQPDHFAEFLPFVSWMPPLKAIERPPIVADPQHWSAMTGAAQAARALPTIPQMDEALKVAADGLAPVFETGTVSAQAAVQQFSPKIDALLA